MKIMIIKLGIFFLNLIYFFFKLFKTKKKVLILSRQSNKKSEDIKLLESELKSQDKNIEVVVLCKKLEKGLTAKIKYFIYIFYQMYHLSTSRVVVLDGYSIVVSILKKKKNTVIIQTWHAIGAFKKFGYSILDQEEGTNSKLALTMKMHENYDYIFTSSEYTKKYFAEAFNYDISKLKVMPLPRVDLLTDKKHLKQIKDRVIKYYPNMAAKKNIVYAPTFRKGDGDISKVEELIDSIDYKKYNLIIKFHPLSKVKLKDERVIIDKKFTTIDMMASGDYVITDYSAIVFEAALLDKPIFFYAYDYSKYYKRRNFYIDYKKQMPGLVEEEANKITRAIEEGNYDIKKIRDFSKRFVCFTKGRCTYNIAKFVLRKL